MIRNNKFAKWFYENQIKTGGLIRKETAAKILDVSHAYIYNLVRDKKLKTYKYENDNIEYISINEISTIKIRQEMKTKK